MKRNKHIKIIMGVCSLIFICSCVTFNNSFNRFNGIAAASGFSRPDSVFRFLSYHDFSRNSLDMQILFNSGRSLMNLHLMPQQNNSEIFLSGVSKSLNNTDSVILEFSFPINYFSSLSSINIGNEYILQKQFTEKDSLYSFLPVYIREIDSNPAIHSPRIYYANCRDAHGNNYSITAVTDPIPLLILIAIGAAAIYRYYTCDADIKKSIEACAKNGSIPIWKKTLFGCEFKGCRNK